MISALTNIRINFFLLKTSILTRRLSNINPNNDDDDYSLSTIMTENVQIKKGKADIRLPSDSVFYNPTQVFNRDLSIACLRLISKYNYANECKKIQIKENGLKIAEALSATRLRSIRYVREIPGIDRIYTNDIDAGAVESIKQIIELNNVKDLVQASHDNAINLLYSHRKTDEQFRVVDLDPYGTPA